MANQGVPSSADRLLKLFGVIVVLSLASLISPWGWLDAIVGLVFIGYLFLWGTASQPNEEYWLGAEERNDPTL